MRVMRVAVVVGLMALMMVGCGGKSKKAVAPPRLLADEDRLPWAANEPTFVVVRKSCRTLDVYHYGRRVRSYPAVFGQGGTQERKLYEGDLRTPSGLYAIIGDRWHERWEHFFLLDYPNAEDARRYEMAAMTGELPVRGARYAGIGGAIGIHGTDKPWFNRQGVDWTWGCISIDNDAVRELASLVYVGTPVWIAE